MLSIEYPRLCFVLDLGLSAPFYIPRAWHGRTSDQFLHIVSEHRSALLSHPSQPWILRKIS